MTKLTAISLVVASALLAQDPEKATVPLHDPARPARIRAHLMAGGITVRGADIRNVVVEANARGGEANSREHRPRRTYPATVDGMKRLDLPGNAGLDVTEDDNVVTIKTGFWNRPADLVITVPRRSSLDLKCMNEGDIVVEQVDGEVDAQNLNGKITLRNVSGSVVAHSLNGTVSAIIDRLDAAKPSSFSTMNGDIDITLPDNLRANVRMKTDNGAVYSDFDVKLETGARLAENETGQRSDGKYHLRFDRSLRGSINGGGPDLQLTTFNGQIFIRKKK